MPKKKQTAPVLGPIPLEWETPNKARVTTGHKSFDSYCNYLGYGNVVSNGQFSSFIRPRTETECNGRPYKEGELRDFDLQPFRSAGLPRQIAKRILDDTETEAAVLSQIFHYRGEKKVIHGFILARKEKLVWSVATGPTYKSERVIDWVAKRITA